MLFQRSFLFCLCLLLAWPGLASGAVPSSEAKVQPIELFEKGDVNLGSQVKFLVDHQERLTFERVRKIPEKKWKQNDKGILDLGFKEKPVWLHLQLPFGEVDQEEWYLNVSNGLLRDVEAFFVKDGELVHGYRLNDIKSVEDKPIAHLDFLFPFTVSANETVDVYVRLNHSQHLLIPLYLESEESMHAKSETMTFLFGIFVGLIGVLILYNFFVYVTTRDLAYIYYVVYIFFAGLYFVSLNGVGFQFVWTESPHVDAYLSTLPIGAVVVFSSLFIIEFLGLRKISMPLASWFYALAGLALLFMAPALSGDFEATAKLHALVAIVAFVSFIVVGVYCWRKGSAPYAVYYVLAWTVFSFTVVYASLAFLGLSEYGREHTYAAQIGSVIEAVLISLALGARIKMLQEESYKAKADNKAKSHFISKMSHEIRTPMTGILGMSELLEERLEDPTDKHYNNVIFQSGQALLTIINDILDYSKIEAGNMEINPHAFDLEKLVLETIELYKARALEKSLELIADIDSNLPPLVKGDAQRVKQVVGNLLSNAVKFTPEGQIILKVLVLDESQGQIKISVIDSGEGIDEEYQQVLFDAFSQEEKEDNSAAITRQSGGVGLGLTICKQLVELMGGSLGFSSRKGLGSTFWFKLSMPPCEGKFLNKQNFSKKELEGKRILIVDDNFTFCELLKIQVEKWGMEAYIAHNGEQAMNMLHQSEKANVGFDLISIDLYMPIMDGLELGRQMSEFESFRNIPRVLLTSIANLPTRSQLLEAGISTALEKPCAASGLYEAFINTIDKSEGGGLSTSSSSGTSESKTESLRILLVEDDDVNQMVIKGILQKLGYSIEILENGQEALEKVQADDRSFDLILMDCEMPIMDGYEATRRIRQWERKNQMLPLVIIALTAHLLDDQRDICLAAGMDNCIDKPVDAKKLNSMIRSYMF
jgi:signal transduction histidine kinase/CheY-like chemotaxis protein